MDPVDNFRAVAQELVSFAHQQGVDLEPIRNDFVFQKGKRDMNLWRKDELPWSGPANAKIGTLFYKISGRIELLPNVFKDSASAFHGFWNEGGTFESVEQAFDLLKAWLIDWKEVDYLPNRHVRNYGIG
jgi:hypothetical protein